MHKKMSEQSNFWISSVHYSDGYCSINIRRGGGDTFGAFNFWGPLTNTTCSVSPQEQVWISMFEFFSDVEPESVSNVVQLPFRIDKNVGLIVLSVETKTFCLIFC